MATHEWLRETGTRIASDYVRFREIAKRDPQQSGHLAESTWADLLKKWLPSGYGVGVRKYIIPEEGDDTFETDLVVFNRSYPEALRENTHVLAGGVAAAFSVKLTLDADGIRDAVERAARLRRSLNTSTGSASLEARPAFPFGLLALSHSWTQPKSQPRANVSSHLEQAPLDHPRLALDYVCVPDLALWRFRRMLYLPPEVAANVAGHSPEQLREGFVATSFMMSLADDGREGPTSELSPVAFFIADLWSTLAKGDGTLQPLADTFLRSGTLGWWQGVERWWNLSDVYSHEVKSTLIASRRWVFNPFD